MLERIISGGQTGVDQAGLFAARRFGIVTGGWAPRGWLTEDGAAPRLGTDFGLVECQFPVGNPWEPRWKWQAACYVARTKRNAAEADLTIWLGKGDSTGFGCTAGACRTAGKPIWTVHKSSDQPADHLAVMIVGFDYNVINIAGNRESKAVGIRAAAERYLGDLFRAMGHRERM